MVINGFEQYAQLKERMDREQYIVTPIHLDFYAHPSINPILCSGITFLNNDTYILSTNHSDAHRFELPETPHKIDPLTVAYIHNITSPEMSTYYTAYINESHAAFSTMRDINRIIPIATWSTILKQYNSRLIGIVNMFPNSMNTPQYNSINSALAVLRTIESSGLSVDGELLIECFGDKVKRYLHNGFVYSQYNLFTATGRPSNRYGGINYAALNKTDGTRAVFNSRFTNGSLIQLDFEAYHLRLIGQYAGMSMPQTSLHEYLAKQYFKKEHITEDEYEAAKQTTFGVLYGTDVETDVPLLETIRNTSDKIYAEYLEHGKLLSPVFKREIVLEEVSKNKVFNYFVQAMEFEATIDKLRILVDGLKNKQSKVILYTYDAVLLDCPKEEIEEVVAFSQQILEEGGYPVRTYLGKNYNELMIF